MCPEDYPQTHKALLEVMNARILQFPFAGNKEPFVDISETKMREAVRACLGKRRRIETTNKWIGRD